MFNSYPFYSQSDRSDCGIACLRMIAKYFGVYFLDSLIDFRNITPHGISVYNLMELSKKVGFEPVFIETDFDKVKRLNIFPFILFCDENHFIVVYKIAARYIIIGDPAVGLIRLSYDNFFNKINKQKTTNISIIHLLPTERAIPDNLPKYSSSFFLFKYLRKFKKQIFFLLFGLILSSIIDIMFPFLTKKLVDKGVVFNNDKLIYIVVAAQVFLTTAKFFIEMIRSWLIIHIGSRIGIYIISDFLAKLFTLPISFFSSKSIGDLTKRVNDNNIIEAFVSDSFIKSIFSVFSFFVLSFILFSLHHISFYIFLFGCIFQLAWVLPLLPKIKLLKKNELSEQSSYQANLYEMIAGIQEVKLNNIAGQKIDKWEAIQANLFKWKIKSLKVNQFYKGYTVVTTICMCAITLVCSLSLSSGKISTGEMFAIFSVLALLNSPLNDIINAALHWQYAKSSFERLDEVNKASSESHNDLYNIHPLTDNCKLVFSNASFTYVDNSINTVILNNLNLEFLPNKITAIVGLSGSGKTTLVKLLLKLYDLQSGTIMFGERDLRTIPHSDWRSMCGAVLQDSYVFSDSIAYNITMSDNYDENRLKYAIKIARLNSFVENLPLKENTRIGQNGWGISQGQRQRILIARVVYKDPKIIIFDEATNALDAENETVIVENLNRFFKNKTVILVAHRLSTVKNADKIIVLENGNIDEIGNHSELISNGGRYFSLVKNQLELNN